jgi:hypothetical protein
MDTVVKVAEVRSHCHIDSDTPDTDILPYLMAAEAYVAGSLEAEALPDKPLVKLAVLMLTDFWDDNRDGRGMDARPAMSISSIIEKLKLTDGEEDG